jgi:hypothetical protein
MGVAAAQRRSAAADNTGPGTAEARVSAAIAASITWRNTAERLSVPWERRWSSQASCASVMETLRGGAKEAMDV